MCNKNLPGIVLLLITIITQSYLLAQDTIGVATPPIIEEYADTSSFDTVSSAMVSMVEEKQVPDSVLKNLLNDEDFWYANQTPLKEKQVNEQQSFLWKLSRQQWFKVLAWIIIAGGFAGVLLWYLATSNVRLFRRQAKSFGDGIYDSFSENIFTIDYDTEIQKAIDSANYRFAVRLMYLQTLKSLSQTNKIKYQQQKTNYDYVLQLFNTSYYKPFFKLTRNFEYTWYGQFEVSENAFVNMKKDFSDFKMMAS
jgi:hypothetical protein